MRVGDRKQIRPPYKQMSKEMRYFPSFGNPNPHDAFPTGKPRANVLDLVAQLHAVGFRRKIFVEPFTIEDAGGAKRGMTKTET